MSAAPARPHHHFEDALLFAYAAGSLPQALSILVATHACLCPSCRAVVADAEALGGVLLEDLEPQPLAPDALDRVLARLDAEEVPDPAPPPPRADESPWPAPLRGYLGADPDAFAWRPLAPGIDQVPVYPAAPPEGAWPAGGQLGLVRLAPGAVAPRHTHAGIEATVILQGGFTDDNGTYERGDACLVDASVTHAPIGLPGAPCFCLVYLDAPLQPVDSGHVASI